MAGLELQSLSKCHHPAEGAAVVALDEFTLAVAAGARHALVGPSGSGKTTLLRIIAGLERAESGSVILDGQLLDPLPPQQRDVALVPQQRALYPHLTVRDNVTLGLRLRRFPVVEVETRLNEVASALGVTALLDRRPGEISGGEQQRVALARALVRRPKLLLLDEPLSHLDAPLRHELRGLLVQFHERWGGVWLCVLHDQDDALRLAPRVSVMRAGRLEQSGAPETLVQQPANLFVAGFIGSPPMNFADGGSAEFQTAFPGARAPGATPFWTFGIRAADVTVTEPGSGNLRGVVLATEWDDGGALVCVQTPFGPWRACAPRAVGPVPGVQVGLKLNLHAAHAFDTVTGRRLGGLSA